MKVAPWLIAAVLGLVLVLGYGQSQRRQGELKERIARLESETRRVDTVYRVKVKWRAAVAATTDSTLASDTTFSDTTVRRLILGERQACNAVIETCEHRVAVRDSTIKALKRKPSVWSKVPWVLGGVVAGKLLLK